MKCRNIRRQLNGFENHLHGNIVLSHLMGDDA